MASGDDQATGMHALLVILAVGIVLGLGKGVQAASSGSATDTTETYSSTIAIDDGASAPGTLRVTTTACQGIAHVDQVEYQVKDGGGSIVDVVTEPFYPNLPRQSATLGQGLAPGTYQVVVTCMAGGQPVDDFRVTSATVQRADGSPSTTNSPRNLPLPNTGR